MRQPDDTDRDDLPTIAQLRRYEGDPREFWPRFLHCAREVTGAVRASLAVRVLRPAPETGAAVESWRVLAAQPRGGATLPDASILGLALAEGLARTDRHVAFAVGGAEAGEGVVVLETDRAECLVPLPQLAELLGALPDGWQAERARRGLLERLEGITGAIDLGLVVAGETTFTPAAFATCNELAARFRCDRVSLGWQDDSVLRLQAISQADKFDRRADFVRQLEIAMEECLDQDAVLVVPAPEDADTIVREHRTYARSASVEHLCSLPLTVKGVVHGVLMLERAAAPFGEEERSLLGLVAHQIGSRLAELRERDRWWPVRLWRKLKASSAGWLGPRHTGAKLAGVAAALVLLFLVFGRLPYTVKAPATVRSGQVVFVTAPFDGFIEAVSFKVGDTVAAGAELVAFDTRELLVQEAAELAELNRFEKEVERARARNELADMRVAEAQAEQARAVLARTQYHLEQARITAPIDGVIVEGDLRKRLGSPVQQGEVLLQTARLDELYIQIEISERAVHDVLARTEARMLFAAQPDRTFDLAIERIQPGGWPGEAGVVFLARARPTEAPPPWWRPGMSGTVKIEAGWRNAGWILTHRTTDWLRRQLWW